MTVRMPVAFQLCMDGRDVGGWATSLEVSQARRTLYRQWRATLAGWNDITSQAAWDVFATYDPDDPRAECLVRAGVIPPDQEPPAQAGTDAVPTTAVEGYDKVWLIQRRQPRDTVILAPEADGPSVRQAIANYAAQSPGRPIGSYQVWPGMRTLHLALQALGRAAGVNVRCLFTDFPIQALVVDPSASYWETMLKLLEPVACEAWYRRSDNELVLCDATSPLYGLGPQMTIPSDIITRASAVPVRRRRIRRVIFRVPRC